MDNYLSDSVGGNAAQWGVSTRTMRRFFQAYNAADGDLNLGADMAPQFDLAKDTFIALAEMLHTGSLDAMTYDSGEDGAASVLDTFDGAPLGGEVENDYDRLLDQLTAQSIMQNAQSPDHLRVIRKAYGFEGDLDVGEGSLSPMLSSRDSLVAHIDMTVAANLSHEDGEKWSRPKVQRLRTAQLKAWRSEHTKSDVSDGKDEN